MKKILATATLILAVLVGGFVAVDSAIVEAPIVQTSEPVRDAQVQRALEATGKPSNGAQWVSTHGTEYSAHKHARGTIHNVVKDADSDDYYVYTR